MPLFDFQCECEKIKSDVWLKFAEDTPENHPKCECGKQMTKMASRVTGVFRGRGFHATDYRAPTRGF